MLKFINSVLLIMGIILLIAGCLQIVECVKKKDFGGSFCSGGGMLVFGLIIIMAWISC